MRPGQLVAYKDQKHAKQDKYIEEPINLSGSVVEEATEYKKRKHCFSLKKPAEGSEFMFKAKDDAEMNLWIDCLKKAAAGEAESSTMSQSGRAQTLPTSASAPEKKKGGFFTMRRA